METNNTLIRRIKYTIAHDCNVESTDGNELVDYTKKYDHPNNLIEELIKLLQDIDDKNKERAEHFIKQLKEMKVVDWMLYAAQV